MIERSGGIERWQINDENKSTEIEIHDINNQFVSIKSESGDKIREIRYDQKGRIIEDSYYNGNDYFSLQTVNEYDKQGKMIRTTNHFDDQKDDVTNYQYISYDDKGNWIKAVANHEGERIIIIREIGYR